MEDVSLILSVKQYVLAALSDLHRLFSDVTKVDKKSKMQQYPFEQLSTAQLPLKEYLLVLGAVLQSDCMES